MMYKQATEWQRLHQPCEVTKVTSCSFWVREFNKKGETTKEYVVMDTYLMNFGRD